MNLVADIGGTSSRFALCEPGSNELLHIEKYRNAEFAGLAEAIRHYTAQTQSQPDAACVAVAGPVLGDDIRFTNLPWAFSQSVTRSELGLQRLVTVNDFTALAMGIPGLPPEEYAQVGSGTPHAKQAIAVLGPGTGLGVSGLLWSSTQWVAMAGEGGNVTFAPGDELERAMMQLAQQRLEFVAVEEFVSGRGLVFIYQILCQIHGEKAEDFAPEDITRRAVSGECAQCLRTVERFCAILGSYAGDVALLLGAFGGVYIGGGITPLLGDLFAQSPFRTRFEAKGRFQPYLAKIPTYTLHSHARVALRGAANILNGAAS